MALAAKELDREKEPTPDFKVRRVNLTLNPTPDEQSLVGELKNLFYKARTAKRPITSQWYKNYRVLRNRTWAMGRPEWLPAPEVPEIYPIVTSMVGWMTDQRPQLEIAPFALPNSEFYSFMDAVADDLAVAIKSTWTVNGWDSEIERMLWDGWTYGTGFLKATWDSTLDLGLGNASLKRLDPFTIYPDPAATSMDNSNYFIEAYTISLQEMDRRWPGSTEKLRQGMVEDVDEHPRRTDDRTQVPRTNPGAISPNTSPSWGRPGQGREAVNPTDDPGITVFECWLREHDVVEESKDDVCVYDTWRVVVVAGNRVLMDEDADELWSHGKHPYVRYVPHEVGEFWGFSIVEMLAPSQLSINRLLGALQLNVELVGNPIFIEGSRSGMQRQRVTNKPGSRHTVNDNSRADWLNPPQVHPMMMGLIEWYIKEMERVSGLSAITRGSTPSGRNAQGVLDSVQEASFVRIRMALRNLEYSLREAGNLIASLIVEYYDEPRFVAIVGTDGTKSMRALKARHFYVPTEAGQQPMKYTLQVTAGSQLATSPAQRRADAIQLGTLGFVPPADVLEAFDWPHREQSAAQANAIQASGGGPGSRQKAGRTS